MLQFIYKKLISYFFVFIVSFIMLSIFTFSFDTESKNIHPNLPLTINSPPFISNLGECNSNYSSPSVKLASELLSLEKVINNIPSNVTSHKKKANNKKNLITENAVNISNFPVKTGHISSRFGLRKDPIHGKSRLHKGLEVAARSGTFVYPLGEGKVIFSGYKSGYGNIVEIKHSSTVVTRYAHLAMSLIDVGRTVNKDDIIGLVGKTGRSTGPHLHLEITFNGTAVNPELYLEKVRPSSIAQK